MFSDRRQSSDTWRTSSVSSGQSGPTAWFIEAEYIRQNKNNSGRFNNVGTNHGVSNLGTGLKALQEGESQCKSVDLYTESRRLEFDNIDTRRPVQGRTVLDINGPSKKSKKPYIISVEDPISLPWRNEPKQTDASFALDDRTICNGTTDGISNRKSTESHSLLDNSTTGTKSASSTHLQTRLGRIYDKVLIVNNIPAAKEVVSLLTNQYRHLIHACEL